MSVKSKISSLSKLYSFYEKIPEDYLDESDVDAYFYHNILDITPSQHRIFRVGKGPNNNLFAFKVFQFCDLIYKQKYILEEEIILTKQELALILDNLRNFLKNTILRANNNSTQYLNQSKSWVTRLGETIYFRITI